MGEMNITIETLSGCETLFKGKMVNGVIQGKVDQAKINHPGWKSRIVIGFVRTAASCANGDIVSPDIRFKSFASTTLKSGKLHGIG